MNQNNQGKELTAVPTVEELEEKAWDVAETTWWYCNDAVDKKLPRTLYIHISQGPRWVWLILDPATATAKAVVAGGWLAVPIKEKFDSTEDLAQTILLAIMSLSSPDTVEAAVEEKPLP